MKVNLRNNANFVADLLNVDGYSDGRKFEQG